MREKFKSYRHEMKLTDGSIVVHTVKSPFPPLNKSDQNQINTNE